MKPKMKKVILRYSKPFELYIYTSIDNAIVKVTSIASTRADNNLGRNSILPYKSSSDYMNQHFHRFYDKSMYKR